MSLSQPRATVAKNPAELYISWKGGDDQGWFEYYDKEIEDASKRNVKVELKDFVVLDKDLFSITGWDDDEKEQYLSNEVREVTDHMVVKAYKKSTDGKSTSSRIAYQGTYEQLKDIVKNSKILKYTRSIYIGFQGRLCHVKLTGAAFSQWIKDVESNSKFQQSFISHVKNEAGKRGNVKYLFPHFAVGKEMDAETLDTMTELDANVLQPYLKEYLARNKNGQSAASSTTVTDTDVFPKEKWREFKLPDGRVLGSMNRDSIKDTCDQYAEAGDVESIAFDCMSQALVDYNQADKTWPDKKDQSGKALSEYTLKELEEVYKKVPGSNKYKIILEVAIEAKKEEESKKSPPSQTYETFDEEDSIPF